MGTVDEDLVNSATPPLDVVAQFNRASPQGRRHPQAIQGWRHHRVYSQPFGLTADAEQASKDQSERDAGATGVDAPAAIERNGALGDSLVSVACLVAILKR